VIQAQCQTRPRSDRAHRRTREPARAAASWGMPARSAPPASTPRLWPLIVDEDGSSPAQQLLGRTPSSDHKAHATTLADRCRRHGYGAPCPAPRLPRRYRQSSSTYRPMGISATRRVCCGRHSIISCHAHGMQQAAPGIGG
jgi:hypothetical protein